MSFPILYLIYVAKNSVLRYENSEAEQGSLTSLSSQASPVGE